MLAIEIDLLTGRYTATTHNDRSAPEWPPHPQRLFSAMVATWADAGQPDPQERAALQWLERQDPPSISCSMAWERQIGTTYVPVNDTSLVRDLSGTYGKLSEALANSAQLDDEDSAKARDMAHREVAKQQRKAASDTKAATAVGVNTGNSAAANRLLPNGRDRQPRSFPTVIPDDPLVTLTWPEARPETATRDRLDALLSRVHRLGHSSTLVSARVVSSPPAPSVVPSVGGPLTIRVTDAGQLNELERLHAAHQGRRPRVLPAVHLRYGEPTESTEIASPIFERGWVVLETVGAARLPITRAQDVARAVRQALMSHGPQPAPEMISGHSPSVSGGASPPSTRAHIALVPLPFVGYQHADGSLHGVALVFPQDASVDDEAAVQQGLQQWAASANGGGDLPVTLGKAGVVRLRQCLGESSRRTLQVERWSRPSRVWDSVTPLAFDRHPGNLRDVDTKRRAKAEASAVESVRRACSYIGLPAPAEVDFTFDGRVSAVPNVAKFPSFQSGQGPRRYGIHTRLTFERPVRGPLLLGAGRYLGAGLFLPVDTQKGLIR